MHPLSVVLDMRSEVNDLIHTATHAHILKDDSIT